VVKVRRYDTSFPEVVKGLISGIEKNDMLLVCYINVQENARKRGLMIGGNRILEVFRPDYAIRVWEADIEAGVDVPVRIHVCEGSDGYTYARYQEPSQTFAPYENDALASWHRTRPDLREDCREWRARVGRTSANRESGRVMVKLRKYDAPFLEVVEGLIAGVEENEMLLVAHVDVQKNARKKGIEVGANQVLEIFRPDYAVRVWEADIEAGVDIPIRIHVYEGSDGHTYARYREPSETFVPYENDALSALGAELDPIFAGILERGAVKRPTSFEKAQVEPRP